MHVDMQAVRGATWVLFTSEGVYDDVNKDVIIYGCKGGQERVLF